MALQYYQWLCTLNIVLSNIYYIEELYGSPISFTATKNHLVHDVENDLWHHHNQYELQNRQELDIKIKQKEMVKGETEVQSYPFKYSSTGLLKAAVKCQSVKHRVSSRAAPSASLQCNHGDETQLECKQREEEFR